jgi:hypothetical protein
VIELDAWLIECLKDRGIPELQAVDETEAVLSRAVDAVDQQLRKNAAGGLVSAYAWADKRRALLVRTGLDSNRQEADRTSALIRRRQTIRAGLSELTGRQFEFVCGVLLDSYGIPKELRHITPASHEGGIDFVAVRKPLLSRGKTRLECLPFRIIGQATQTSSTVGPDKIDAFCHRLDACRKGHGRAWDQLPDWFQNTDAPIVGLFVTSSVLGPSGHQSIRDSIAFAIVGDQVAQDLASAGRAGKWFREGNFVPELLVADLPHF